MWLKSALPIMPLLVHYSICEGYVLDGEGEYVQYGALLGLTKSPLSFSCMKGENIVPGQLNILKDHKEWF